MPRPLWTGTIQISLVGFAVEIYPASNSARPIAFHEVDRRTMGRVHRQNISTGWDEERPTAGKEGSALGRRDDSLHLARRASEEAEDETEAKSSDVRVVEKPDIVKSFEYEKGKFATVEPQELKNLRIPGKKTVELAQFAKLSEIDPALYEKPYFVFPKAGPQAKAFAVIRQSMMEREIAGIGEIVFSGRQHLMALAAPFDDSQPGMMLYTLRFATELRDAKDYWTDKADVAVDRSQLALAKQLTDTFTRPFKPTEYQDQYEQALRELVEAKIHHQAPPEHEPVRKTGKVIDLMEALQKSLAQKKRAAEEENMDVSRPEKKTVASARKGTSKRKSKSA